MFVKRIKIMSVEAMAGILRGLYFQWGEQQNA